MRESPAFQQKTSTSRRDFIGQTIGTVGLAAGTLLAPSGALASGGNTNASTDSSSDGKYEVVPLRSDNVTVGIVQTPVVPVDPANAKATLKKNLLYMEEAIDKAQYFGGHKDLLVFHEFALTGWAQWSRAEALRVAISIPGPEVEAIGAKARQHNCYISFGTYAKDTDWPNHVISMTVLIGPKGDVVSKQWKHRNIHGKFVGWELFTTTPYDVLPRYVEMYGEDALIPVARTDIGNLCFSACVLEPELYRAMAIKGGEFLVRTNTGGGAHLQDSDMRIMCSMNMVYGAFAANATTPNSRDFLEGMTAGNTSGIYDPNGKVIAETKGDVVDCATARIPMAEFRKSHRLPDVHWRLYESIPQYVRFEPGAFLDYLPETLEDSGEYFKTKAKW